MLPNFECYVSKKYTEKLGNKGESFKQLTWIWEERINRKSVQFFLEERGMNLKSTQQKSVIETSIISVIETSIIS